MLMGANRDQKGLENESTVGAGAVSFFLVSYCSFLFGIPSLGGPLQRVGSANGGPSFAGSSMPRFPAGPNAGCAIGSPGRMHRLHLHGRIS